MGALELDTREVTGLLEAAHDGDGSLDAWARRLVTNVRLMLPTAQMVGDMILRRHSDRYELMTGAVDGPHAAASFAQFSAQLGGHDVAVLDGYFRQPERVLTQAQIARTSPSTYSIGSSFLSNWGVSDGVGLYAHAPGGFAMSLFALSELPITLSRRDALLLGRVAAHVEGMFASRLASPDLVAVLRPNGRESHLEAGLRSKTLRDALAAHVGVIERARRRSARHDAERATEAWTALVGGRFGVLERESGGTREYRVVRHPEHVWSGRALTHLEARVLELSSRGMPGKLVAYSLGVSAASVSDALARAAGKLGCASRTELVALAARVLAPDALDVPTSTFTAAEQDVLAALRRGWSNAAIADARGSSQRTVANQVRSLLRKTGRGSRRALAAMGARGTAG